MGWLQFVTAALQNMTNSPTAWVFNRTYSESWKIVFYVKVILNQHHTPKPELGSSWRGMSGGAASIRKLWRDHVSGTLRCKFWNTIFSAVACVWDQPNKGQLLVRSTHFFFTVQKYLKWFATGLTRISLSFSESTAEWTKEQIKIQYLGLFASPRVKWEAQI